MAIKAVLFDLDATLLPMDQKAFLDTYFGLLTRTMVACGYDGEIFVKALKAGTDAIIKNDGSVTNEPAFWRTFDAFYEGREKPRRTVFDRFYSEVFVGTRAACFDDERPRKIVDKVKEKGLIAALATAPAFPAVATETRMGYVGLSPADFSLVTSYENCSFCKPNPKYYLDVAARLGVTPAECLMVGNDVTDDILPALETGMQVFLVTDYLINRIDADIDGWPHGDYDALLAFIASI